MTDIICAEATRQTLPPSSSDAPFMTSSVTSPLPSTPTQKGPEGIRYDFVDGCRVQCPAGAQWRVRFRDLDTASILFDHRFDGGLVQSARRSCVRFGLEVWRAECLIFTHDFDLRGREVLIDMSRGALGDHLAWIGQVERFRRQHGCHLTCVLKAPLATLLRAAYPEIRMLVSGETDEKSYYAAYKLCVFYNDDHGVFQPVDYRLAGLCGTAAYILGLEPEEVRPCLPASEERRPIEEPYVCIATQASGQAKYWNNPYGWRTVVSYLKKRGFRVICIDQDAVSGSGLTWNHIPYGAEDQTGNRPLSERAWWLRHAEFFIGLSSGLSWLAWGAGCRVIMISGFTQPFNEFYTPWRVINRNVCNGCSNDPRYTLETSDYFWCPRYKNTPRQFECSRNITPEQVITTIEKLLIYPD